MQPQDLMEVKKAQRSASNSSLKSAASETTLNRQESDIMSMNSDVISVGSFQSGITNQTNANYISKKYQIELNIKLLYVSDKKYFNEAFKIYWTRGKKKIDTRVAVVKPDTQIGKFNDKFQMKTVLQYDEESNEFKPKPSTLNLFQLEKKHQDEVVPPGSRYKP